MKLFGLNNMLGNHDAGNVKLNGGIAHCSRGEYLRSDSVFAVKNIRPGILDTCGAPLFQSV